MNRVPAHSMTSQEIRGLKRLKEFSRFGVLVVFLFLGINQISAQKKSIVLVDPDIGKTIESIHSFTYDQPNFTFSLKHRMTHNLPVAVTLLRSERFKRGPYSLDQALPVTLNPGEKLDLKFNVDYSRSIRDHSTITLLISPVGDADPKTRGIEFHVDLSAEGRMMFWDNRANKYATTLSNFSFKTPGDKLVELSWNGKGEGKGSFSLENNSRSAYKLISNTRDGAPIPIGTEFPLGKGGKSFFVRYAPPGGRKPSDVGTLVFQEQGGGGNAIRLNLDASGNTKTSTFLAGNNTGGVGAIDIFSGNGNTTTNGNAGNSFTGNGNTTVGGNSSGNSSGNNSGNSSGNGTAINPGVTPNNNTPANSGAISPPKNNGGSGFGTGNLSGGATRASLGLDPKPRNNNNGNGLVPDGGGIKPGIAGSETPVIDDDRPIYDPITAMDRLNAIYENRKGYDHIMIPGVNFKKDPQGNEPDKFTTSIPIRLDTLGVDKNFKFTPLYASALNSKDSVALQILYFDEDSLRLRVGIHPDDEPIVLAEDSFFVHVGIVPYYMAGDQPVYLEDQYKVLKGNSVGKIRTSSNWLFWLLLGIAAFFFLFFLLGRLWIRRPIISFRYLREAKYQRERFRRQEEMTQQATETIYLDLNRHETDLIQLNFLNRNPENPDELLKSRKISATVPTPNRTGMRRFFTWFYGLFGVSKEPNFNSVYYSFRIEPQKGGIPQHLRLKDEDGLLLIGTTMTGNVLATDHQDVRFVERPFTYSIYLDPSEIVDYTGSMRSVSILFRVLEEPFEGYLTTRDFKLDLEIAPKY